MFNIHQSILFNIDKLVGTLKDDAALNEVLKRKFTKKEYKVYVAMESELPMSEVIQQANCDEQRVQELYKSAKKKLNQEQFKQELVI